MSDEKSRTNVELEAKDDLAKTEEKQPTKHKKSHKLRTFLIILAVLIAIPVLIAGWFGFVPGLSNIMGANNPKDLGVVWTEKDFQSYLEKTGTTFKDFSEAPDNPEKPGKKVIFTDPKSVTDLNLTQEEITAAINSLGWVWLPAENVQVRLSQDTVEISGNIKLDYVEEFVKFIGGVGYSESDVNRAADLGRRFLDGSAFYVKGNASVSNDELALSLQEVQVGRFSLPMDIAQNASYAGSSNGIKNTKYLSVDSATVNNGSLTFTGTYPSTIYVKR